jgi:hypothetical protein
MCLPALNLLALNLLALRQEAQYLEVLYLEVLLPLASCPVERHWYRWDRNLKQALFHRGCKD